MSDNKETKQAPAVEAGARDERAQYEAEFCVPAGVEWDGTKYVVREGWENLYVCERFISGWGA